MPASGCRDKNLVRRGVGRVQLLSRNVELFRGGLVFKAYTLLHHSTLGSRLIKKKKKKLHHHLFHLVEHLRVRGQAFRV